MADPDQIAEEVRKILAPRLNALEKKAKEIQELSADFLWAKDPQIRKLITENAAMKRRVEQLEQATRSSKTANISDIPEEKPGARPIDSVKVVCGRLPAQGLVISVTL